jgi:hypothetical protein
MNEESKKRLIDWLGEKWYEPTGTIGDTIFYAKEPEWGHRTFTEWQDFGDVFDKLVEKGEWSKFYYRAVAHFWETYQHDEYTSSDFNAYLHSRTESGEFRLCQLTAKWLTAQKEGGN